MADFPKSVKVSLDSVEMKQALEDAENLGYKKGLEQGRIEMLGWLEHAYIEDQGRPDRDSPKGEAILEIARTMGRHIRELMK